MPLIKPTETMETLQELRYFGAEEYSVLLRGINYLVAGEMDRNAQNKKERTQKVKKNTGRVRRRKEGKKEGGKKCHLAGRVTVNGILHVQFTRYFAP